MRTDDLVDSIAQAAYSHMLTKRDRLFVLAATATISFVVGMLLGIWMR